MRSVPVLKLGNPISVLLLICSVSLTLVSVWWENLGDWYWGLLRRRDYFIPHAFDLTPLELSLLATIECIHTLLVSQWQIMGRCLLSTLNLSYFDNLLAWSANENDDRQDCHKDKSAEHCEQNNHPCTLLVFFDRSWHYRTHSCRCGRLPALWLQLRGFVNVLWLCWLFRFKSNDCLILLLESSTFICINDSLLLAAYTLIRVLTIRII